MNSEGSKSVLGRKGFTVAEMLVALTIASIVFGAVGTLAFAVGRASESTDEMNRSQRSLRYATLRVRECVEHAKLALSVPTNGVAVWTADDNGDNMINGSELIYVESVSGGGSEQLQMLEFPGQNQSVTIAEINSGAARTTLTGLTDERITVLVDNCSGTTFSQIPPGLVNVKFGIVEAGITTHYQISATVAGSADNLIGQTGELVSGDDD